MFGEEESSQAVAIQMLRIPEGKVELRATSSIALLRQQCSVKTSFPDTHLVSAQLSFYCQLMSIATSILFLTNVFALFMNMYFENVNYLNIYHGIIQCDQLG